MSRSALVLVVDRLHLNYLGCFGNSWIVTPAVDGLAWQGVCWDQVVLDHTSLAELFTSWLSGTHALQRSGLPASGPWLLEQLRERGVPAVLATDEQELLAHPWSEAWDEVLELPPAPAADACAPALEQTHLAQAMAVVVEQLQRLSGPFLYWVHLGSLGRVWDAPLEFRNRYVEAEEELPPPESARVPGHVFTEEPDPDQILGLRRAYAGQVTLWDQCLAGLLAALESHGAWPDTMLLLLSARGFSTGLHRLFGWPLEGQPEPPWSELVHVPYLMAFGSRLAQAWRSGQLVQPPDVAPTLAAWWECSAPPGLWGRDLLAVVRQEGWDAPRQLAPVATPAAAAAVRTPAWHLYDEQPPTEEPRLPEDELWVPEPLPTAHLFRKPDDRWEVNDVADRLPEVVARLRHLGWHWRRLAPQAAWHELPELDEVLLHGVE